MARKNEMDEQFRDRLRSFPLSAPPPQDWGRMARLAQQGKTDRALAMATARAQRRTAWLKLFGGACAMAFLWWAAARYATENPVDHSIGALVAEATEPGKAVYANLGANTADSGESGRQKSTPRSVEGMVENTAAHAAHGFVGTRSARSASDATTFEAAERATRGLATTAATAGSTRNGDPPGQRSGSREGPAGSSRGTTIASHASSTDGSQGVPALIAISSDEGLAMAINKTGTAPIRRSEGTDRLPAIEPTGAALSYAPNAARLVDGGALDHAPRFTLSPWAAVVHTTYVDKNASDPDIGDALVDASSMAYRVGLRAEYALSQRFALISGLQYADLGGLQGTITGTDGKRTDFDLNGAYWEVPLAVKYSIPKEGVEYYLRVGALLQINAGTGDNVVYHDDELKKTSTLLLSSTSVGPALDLGAGVRFRMRRGLGLFVEPSYQFAFTPVVKNSEFNQLPYNPKVNSFGLGLGVSIALNGL